MLKYPPTVECVVVVNYSPVSHCNMPENFKIISKF